MDTFSPIVITSKRANQHYDNIKNRHAEILSGIENQTQNLQANRMQKDIDDRQNIERNLQERKEKEESMRKQRELDIKQKALLME